MVIGKSYSLAMFSFIITFIFVHAHLLSRPVILFACLYSLLVTNVLFVILFNVSFINPTYTSILFPVLSCLIFCSLSSFSLMCNQY